MIAVEEARALATEGLRPLAAESVPLADALGRALADAVTATRALPGFTNSAMDGYAVQHASLNGAPLDVVMTLPAGVAASGAVGPGQAARIFTGAVLPPGADTVVIQENTRREGDRVWVDERPRAGANIRHAGSDVAVGRTLVRPGVELHPGLVAMLAAQGLRQVPVVRRPRVAILPNGDELVPIDAALLPGQVPNTNAHMLAAQVLEAGGQPRVFPPIPDAADALTAVLQEATASADLVLTTGGMSVGDFDFAREVLSVAGDLAFHKVRMKPGKPLGLGRIDGVPVLGLPGNPVSAFVGFELFGRPMLRTLAGFTVVDRPRGEAPVASRIRRNRSRPEFVRCRVTGAGLVRHDNQSSGALGSLVDVDVLARIPPGPEPVEPGETVRYLDLRRSR